MDMPYQQQNEGIGVCIAVYGNAVAEGIGTHGYALSKDVRVCTAVYGNAVAEGIGAQNS